MTAPLIGDFGVVATNGWEARVIQWATASTVNHAFVYVGGGQIVEADPNGARLAPAKKYPNAIWAEPTISADEGHAIADAAKATVGTPYGWADIVAIALAQRRLGSTVDSHTWWAKRIASTNTLICSQLVDVAYQRAGVQLFDDGRLPGLVSPGDLLTLAKTWEAAA